MELSKREKNLLIVLGVILLFWGYYKFIISLQFKNLEEKQKSQAHYENELIKAQTITALEEEIDNKFAHINSGIDALSKRYFSEIDQSRFILLINELLGGTDLFVQNISFFPRKIEGVGNTQVEIMSAVLPYEGEYTSLFLFLERIRKCNPKIIIQNLNIKIKEKELLSGSVSLDFYSLPGLVKDSSTIYLFDSSETNPDPFYSFEDDFIVDDDWYDEYYGEIDLSNVEINFDDFRVLIEGFDNKVLDFVPSHPSIKGEIAVNKNSKQGTGSLGLYYSFPPIQEEKQVHVILNRDETIVSKPPEGISLWVYSYDATRHGIRLKIRDKEGEEHGLDLCEEIDWIGWKHLKVDTTHNKFIFPIGIERIIIDIKSPDYGKGTLLFDALEAFYAVDFPSIDDNSIGNYKLYDVQVGDTLDSISKAFYNNASYQDIIKKYNGIGSNSDLKPGRIIIIPDMQPQSNGRYE